MNLTIESSDTPAGVILTVQGEVDMESSPRLRDEIKKVVKRKPAALKLKLENVPYIDSSGVAVLIEGLRWCGKEKIAFTLVSISASVRGVLQLSKLMTVFKVEEG